MNVHYWPAIPLATLAAIAIAYVLYVEERQHAANPLKPWFESEDDPHLAHLPHPWSVTPPEWRRR